MRKVLLLLAMAVLVAGQATKSAPAAAKKGLGSKMTPAQKAALQAAAKQAAAAAKANKQKAPTTTTTPPIISPPATTDPVPETVPVAGTNVRMYLRAMFVSSSTQHLTRSISVVNR